MVSFIDTHRALYGVESICAQLPIAPSLYYEHKAREVDPARLPPRLRRDRALTHGYWPGIHCPLDAFEAAQVALARKFSGDESVSDLPRVMRLPGFFHQKREPFMSRII